MDNNIVEQILQLRTQGMSMRGIARELGISHKTVNYHCKKHGVDGDLDGSPLEKFLKNLNKNHSLKFEYVSGYIDSEKPVLIRCKKCNHEFKRAAQFARKKKNVNCPNCKQFNQSKDKTKPINKEIEQLRKRILKGAIKTTSSLIEIHVINCDECGSPFVSKTRKRMLCSKTCINRRDNRLKELRKRKARINGKVDYSITIEKLIQKEKNVCYLCGGQCDLNDFTIDNRGSFIVGRNYPSIEHVIPISKGGTHSWDNVKLAHHYCNSIKNDKKIVEDSGQLVLML